MYKYAKKLIKLYSFVLNISTFLKCKDSVFLMYLCVIKYLKIRKYSTRRYWRYVKCETQTILFQSNDRMSVWLDRFVFLLPKLNHEPNRSKTESQLHRGGPKTWRNPTKATSTPFFPVRMYYSPMHCFILLVRAVESSGMCYIRL